MGMDMGEIQYIKFDKIQDNEKWMKFKEFYFDKEINEWKPVTSGQFHFINMHNLDSIMVSSENDFVNINGMLGRFFL